MSTTHRTDEFDFLSLVIDAYAQAEMDSTDDLGDQLPRWVSDRFEAVRVAGDKYVLSNAYDDDERISLVATNQYGAVCVELRFPATPVGLAMFVAASRAV